MATPSQDHHDNHDKDSDGDDDDDAVAAATLFSHLALTVMDGGTPSNEGDVTLTNLPRASRSHLPDMTARGGVTLSPKLLEDAAAVHLLDKSDEWEWCAMGALLATLSDLAV